MDKTNILKDLQIKMEKALKNLEQEFKGLRTGRASVNLLEAVEVEAYGEKLPITQVASLATPDARTITVQVWDKSMVKAVEKSIIDANLGVTPSSDGQLVRISIPSLTEERRKELAKIAHRYGEESKVTLRHVRRDGNEDLKKFEKDNLITEDELSNLTKEIQKLTDEFSKKIDEFVKQKEQEIMKV